MCYIMCARCVLYLYPFLCSYTATSSVMLSSHAYTVSSLLSLSLPLAVYRERREPDVATFCIHTFCGKINMNLFRSIILIFGRALTHINTCPCLLCFDVIHTEIEGNRPVSHNAVVIMYKCVRVFGEHMNIIS